MSSQLYTNTNGRLAVVMVGLPGTGKTFTARNLSRYLRWLGVHTRTFSVAAYRRTRLLRDHDHDDGANSVCCEGTAAAFFDPENVECLRVRTEIADQALQDLLGWLDHGRVGILDGSNTMKARRDVIENKLLEHNVQCVFLECISQGVDTVNDNIEGHVEELLLTCPEYAGWRASDAIADYKVRIGHYKRHYQSLSDHPPSASGFLQLVNGGEQLIVERVNGFLLSRITYYLMNLRQSSAKRSIFLLPIQEGVTTASDIQSVSRLVIHSGSSNGHWTCNSGTSGDIGGVQIWTPTVPAYSQFRMMPRLRALEIGCPATPIAATATQPPSLLTLDTLKLLSTRDPYFARNPQGESYHDLAIRLEPVIMELEGGYGVTVIAADPTILRCIYGYFCETATRAELVAVEMPVGVVVGLRPRAYGCYERHFRVTTDGAACSVDVVGGEETLRLYNDNIVSPK